MRLTVTTIIGADALGELVRGQQTCRLGDRSFAMHPLGLNRVQPGALARQEAGNEAYTLSSSLHLAIVRAEPLPDVLALVPGGIVPNQEQRRDALSCQPLATPSQEVGRDGTDRATVHEAQQHLVRVLLRPAHQHAVTGQRLGVRIVVGLLQLLKPKLGVGVDPAVLLRLGEPAPPDLVGKANRPCRVIGRQPD